MNRVVARLPEDITIGDICTLFAGNTDAYDYLITLDDGGVLTIQEPK